MPALNQFNTVGNTLKEVAVDPLNGFQMETLHMLNTTQEGVLSLSAWNHACGGTTVQAVDAATKIFHSVGFKVH